MRDTDLTLIRPDGYLMNNTGDRVPASTIEYTLPAYIEYTDERAKEDEAYDRDLSQSKVVALFPDPFMYDSPAVNIRTDWKVRLFDQIYDIIDVQRPDRMSIRLNMSLQR